MLWIFSELASLSGAVIAFVEPGMINQIIAGEIQGELITLDLLLVLAILLLVQPLMAFLTLIMKEKINRWANMIVALVWTILGLADLPTYAANPKGYEILTWLVSIIATLLIIWYAYKWPKET